MNSPFRAFASSPAASAGALALLMFFALRTGAGGAAPPLMVKDINKVSVTMGSDPAGFAAAGTTVFFSAGDATHGRELWRTDGTPEGTAMVKDILPGTIGSQPRFLTSLGGVVYFEADSGTGGQLWKSDGTATGT